MKITDIATALAGKYPEWIVFVVTHDPNSWPDPMPADRSGGEPSGGETAQE